MQTASLQVTPAPANPYVREALSAYRIFSSMTPATFAAKWPHHPHRANQRVAIVFNDILRATTTLTAVLARGALGIHLAVKNAGRSYDVSPPVLPNEKWVIGGEEDGRPISGGMIDNSPLSALGADIEGKYLKFFSTNGARALQAILQADNADVFLMCVANVAATMKTLALGDYAGIWFVNGAFYGAGCMEDVVATGRAIGHLIDEHGIAVSDVDDEALIMRLVAQNYPTDEALLAALEGRQVPRLLAGLHKTSDVACAATGAGLGEVWSLMARTVVKVVHHDGVPLLAPLH